MGLDMYLTKQTYVKNWDFMDQENRHEISITKGGKPTNIKPERISYIVEEVIYWRKANAIHAWFVKNCQDGKDECQDTYIPREKLEELLYAVKTVLSESKIIPGEVHTGTSWKKEEGKTENYKQGKIVANPDVAKSYLPTQSGFFFGGTDYDEYYIQDLRFTAEKLQEILQETDSGSFYYQASW